MRNERYHQKMLAYMSICEIIASLSYDTKFQVGTAIITDDFREICAIGYNGNFKGGPNCRESNAPGMSGFLHSEENALLHLSKPYENRGKLIMLCTHKPCPMCAKRIVNSGIKTVLYLYEYDNAGPGTDDVFKVGNVVCTQIQNFLQRNDYD